ncbi:MAG: TraB/GumN family protein [Blastomonas sp.]
MRLSKKLILAMLPLALAPLGGATAFAAQDTETAETPATAPKAVVTDIDPALWVLRDADTTIYLFGTVHILRPGLSWFDDGIRTAFDSADEIVQEIVEPDHATMQQLIAAKAVDPEGRNLREQLGDEERAAYEKALAGIGLPQAMFDKFEPWFAAVTLTSLPLLAKGYDLDSGAEKVLTIAAKQANKPVSGLETPEQQIEIFDSMPREDQLAYLNVVVAGLDSLEQEIDMMVDSWASADTKTLGHLMNGSFEDTPDLAETLLTNRNIAWTDWIEQRMAQPGTVFIGVGAGHLAGPHSVQAQLAKRGYVVGQIVY